MSIPPPLPAPCTTASPTTTSGTCGRSRLLHNRDVPDVRSASATPPCQGVRMGTEHSHFDEKASTWDDADKVRRSDEIARAVAAAVPLATTTRVLEYGAGTGLVSQALQDR